MNSTNPKYNVSNAELQPILVDEWGCTFYGDADLVGTVWWYTTAQGQRRPLIVKNKWDLFCNKIFAMRSKTHEQV